MGRVPSKGLLALLTCAMGIGPLINLGLGATSALVISDLQISVSQYGMLSSTCFTLAALGSMSLGKLSDRISSRAQMAIIFGGSAVTLGLAALSMSYFWLLVALALAGLVQAMSNPTTNRLVVLYAPEGHRESWIGVKQSGLQASQLFAGLSFPSVALLVGWRGALAYAAILAIALLFWAWWQLPAEPQRVAQAVNPELQKKQKRPARKGPGAMLAHAARFRSWRADLVTIYSVQSALSSIGLTATNVFLPLFAHQVLGYSLVLAGLTTALSGALGVVFRVYWTRRMAFGARTGDLMTLLAAGSVAAGLALAISGHFQIGLLLWGGVLLHAGTTLGINSVLMAGAMRAAPEGSSGSATGVVSLGMYAGIALGPLLVGLTVDGPGGFTAGWLLVAGINVSCLLFSALLRNRAQ